MVLNACTASWFDFLLRIHHYNDYFTVAINEKTFEILRQNKRPINQ